MLYKTSFAINRIQEQVVLNIYVRMTILDLSKIEIYKFHYNCYKYDNNNIRSMFTDTDSLLYEIKTEDACKALYEEEADKAFYN